MKKVSVLKVASKCYGKNGFRSLSILGDLSNVCGIGSPRSLRQRLYGILDHLGIVIWEIYPNSSLNDFWDENIPDKFFPDSIGMIEWLGDHPKDWRLNWLRGFQGVAHNPIDKHWIFTKKKEIFSYHVSKILQNRTFTPSYVISKKMPWHLRLDGFNHFGDPDWCSLFQKPYLFVPIEHRKKRKFSKIGIYSDESSNRLKYEGSLDLIPPDNKKDAPWLAVHPKNGLIFTSLYKPINQLRVYRFLNTGIAFYNYYYLYDNNGGSIEVKEIQGGCFSPSGHLFLFAQSGTYNSGIYGFDMRTGRLSAFLYAEIHTGAEQEFEGITVWNLDLMTDTAEIKGQIHAVLIDNVASHGLDFYFKHWRVEFPENL